MWPTHLCPERCVAPGVEQSLERLPFDASAQALLAGGPQVSEAMHDRSGVAASSPLPAVP